MALFNDDISINSIIGKGSSIKGNIKINGFIRIDGDLDGDLETTGNVIVGENARIRGNIQALSITIGGIVKGNITASSFVHLLSSSAVIGDVQSHKIMADEDAVLHGHCISLAEDQSYQEAVKYWQSSRSISSKSILKNLTINSQTAKE